MLSLHVRVKDSIKNVHRREEGQDGFEYMLVVGGVSVGLVLAMVGLPGLIGTTLGAVSAAVTGAI